MIERDPRKTHLLAQIQLQQRNVFANLHSMQILI